MAATKKKLGKRVLALIAAVMVCMSITMTASANTADERIHFWSRIEWKQADGERRIALGSVTPPSNINTSGIRVYGIACSPQAGEFKIILQKQGFLGQWFQYGNTYTVKQDSLYAYDPRSGTYVNGHPFSCSWSTNEIGNYRIVMFNPTKPQQIALLNVDVWVYGSNDRDRNDT